MKKATDSTASALPWVRRNVQALRAYVPGEQPAIPGLVKLNTNENPYPPSPKVIAAIQAATDQRLRLYPNPTAQALRDQVARLHRCRPANVLIGNGCDDILALAVRAFVEPADPCHSPHRSRVQFFSPSYSLYPVLADIHGARSNPVPLRPDFGIPSAAERAAAGWDKLAALTFITTPNAPSGRGYTRSELDRLCAELEGVVLLDETYVDFAREPALDLALQHPHVLVARTFSKAYSLCFQRVGYVIGPPPLIEALDKIRDSYNVNGLGQVAALATLRDLTYYRRNFRRIIDTRQRIAEALILLDFRVFPSQTNFLLVQPPHRPAEEWQRRLRDYKILVRWFPNPEVRAFLRVSIGSDPDMNALLVAVRKVMKDFAATTRSQAGPPPKRTRQYPFASKRPLR
jgi:histidinol-phosphate aminotransferase